MKFNIITLAVGLALTSGAGGPNAAQAQGTLSGSGLHLPEGAGTYPVPGVTGLSYVDNLNGTFTGNWTATPQPNWVGSVTLTGPLVAGSGPNGTSTFDFSGLTYGVLPGNSYFFFSDLDNGSGPEHFTLQAFDATHTAISSPWLTTPIGQAGVGSPADMPGWDWNSTTSNAYTFDGGTVPGNPTVGFVMESSLAMDSLVVVRDSSFANFAIGAPEPVPEPTTLALFAGGLGLLLKLRRRK